MTGREDEDRRTGTEEPPPQRYPIEPSFRTAVTHRLGRTVIRPEPDHVTPPE